MINPQQKNLSCQIGETFFFVAISIGFLFLPLSSASAEGTNCLMPPFIAQGSVSTEMYSSGDPTPFLQDEGKFLFSYSNRVWEIQIETQNAGLGNIKGIDPKKLTQTIINCKRIPEGIRYFVTRGAGQTNQFLKSVPRAIAEPIQFPPPDKTALLTCWLSLCPEPDLPTIDSTQIHRFLSVGLFKNPMNAARYSKEYLRPDNLFLSILSITNDGTVFISETETIKLGSPFQNGFEELAFEVVKTTNFNGFLFPLQTTFMQFAPRINAKDRQDVYPLVAAHLTIEKIDFGAVVDTNSGFLTPKTLVAIDRRTPDLPDGESAPYSVKNDQWVPHTNPQVALIASLTRAHGKKMRPDEHPGRRAVILTILATISVAPLAWIILIRSVSKKKNKQ